MTKNTSQPKEYIIDATDKKLGRVATQAAVLLRGKQDASFERHIMPNVRVVITNASKINLEGKMDKEYARYSGYPGGLRKETRGHMIDRKGYKTIFEKTIYGMIPANRLRKDIMKNLIIND